MPKSFVTQQSYYFKAPVEKVFQSLSDSKKLTKWFLSKAKVVPEKGGTYTFNWLGGYQMTGKVKQFDPNKAIAFSWNDKLGNGQVAKTTASFKMATKGKGTLLTLRHTRFKDPRTFCRLLIEMGYYLTNLKSVLDHNSDLRSKHDW
jgi:uncharacterized protein YndB with AHSA1/START domain